MLVVERNDFMKDISANIDFFKGHCNAQDYP